MKEVIRVEQATKDFGKGRGVFDISLSVGEGEVFGYLGPNGAGKSTTIRQLIGFLRPDSGNCQMLGMDCFKQAGEVHRSLGYLAGEIAFPEDMTGTKYLKFMAAMKGITDFTRMKELVERFECNPEGRIRKMSKGMKQKLAIICAFMGEPRVVILDEPTSGLDPLMQNRFIEMLLEEREKGTTVFLSSHILEEVEKTCDRTAIIREGRIADVVDMPKLTRLREKSYTVTLKDAQSAKQLAAEPALQIKEVSGCRVSLRAGGGLAQVLRTVAEYDPVDLEENAQTLEEIFLHYYGKDGGKNA